MTSLKWVLMWISGGESVKEPNAVFNFMKGFLSRVVYFHINDVLEFVLLSYKCFIFIAT